MTSVESSRKRSTFGTIGCSERIACSTRASVEKPVLPRRLRDRPSFSNRISPSCWGEAIVNSVPASSKISPSSSVSSVRTRSVIARQALDVQSHPEQLHVAQHRHQRQLDLLHHLLQAAGGDLLALPVRERGQHHRAARQRVLQSAAEAPLLGQLLERVPTPGRLGDGGNRRQPAPKFTGDPLRQPIPPHIPPGTRVVEESGDPIVDATAGIPGLTGTAARAAAEAFRRGTNAVSAARSFLDNLRGHR